MLDAYIIDAIRKEELERERAFERRRIWLELPLPPRGEKEEEKGETPADQDPVVIPFKPEMPIRRGEEDAA